MAAPLVALTGRHLPPGRVTGWSAGAVALSRYYVDALDRAGARPAVLAPSAAPSLAGFAGLVLAGGADVEPARYGAEAHPATYGVDPELDAFELALLAQADAAGLPVLAICRGHQLLNVACGGSLRQHLPDAGGPLDHGPPAGPAAGPGGGVDHAVEVLPDTLLAEALGVAGPVTGRSHHHQAVDRVGAGLRVSARAADGCVEGLERDEPGRWVVAVQWHPEVTAAADPVQQRLFDRFAEVATAGPASRAR